MRAARVLGGLVLVLVLAAAGLWFARLPLAEIVAREALKGQGFETESIRVTRLSLSEIAISDLEVRSDTVSATLDSAAVTFAWRALIAERRVQNVRIGPGLVRVSPKPGGASEWDEGDDNLRTGTREGLPFDRLEIIDLALEVAAPQGQATAAISADFSSSIGGAASVILESDALRLGEWAFASTRFQGQFELEADGVAAGEGGLQSQSITTPYGTLRDVKAAARLSGNSWADLLAGDVSKVTGQGEVSLERLSGTIADEWSGRAAVVFGAPVEAFEAAGALAFNFDETGFSVSSRDDPLSIVTDNEISIHLDALEETPLFSVSDGEKQAAFSYALNGPALGVSGDVRAQSAPGGWDIAADTNIEAYRHSKLSVENAIASFEGLATDDEIIGALTVASDIDRVSVGRLSVSDAAARAAFSVAHDRESGVTQIAFPKEECLVVDDADIMLAGQDMDSSVRKASLCNRVGPLATIRMGAEPIVDFAGVLSAEAARYRLGRTTFAGAPPVLAIDGAYRPSVNETRARADVSGGSIVLNEFLRFTEARGAMDISLVGSDFRIDGALDRVRAAETRAAPFAAPAYGAVEFALQDSIATFDYSVRTRSGVPIGKGAGEHQVRSGRGEADFTTDRLAFAGDGGLQPELMMPVLKGIIGATIGAAQADAKFRWGPDGIGSSAEIDLQAVTFDGPTRVVSQTRNVNGLLSFSNLWPPTTDGVQSVTVEGVDLSQLQLEDGVVRFELPGDGTLYVEHAEFPWFGGRLGVYDARASITGGTVSAPLQAVDVDITELLEFINLNGLTGEGTLEGVLPLVVEEGRARIENGVLRSVGPGSVSYQGAATDEAAAAGGQAQIAFDILRDLQFDALEIVVNGPLDGRLTFQMNFEGSGEISLNEQPFRMPVIYRVTLDAALLDLLNQAVLTQDIQLQINRAQQGDDAAP
ncbi:MAG: YdbH domain-containing protein [Pseudomonadota bacterium]